MSLEMVKESVRINQVVAERSTQTLVENDIIVPDARPDVGRVLVLDGDVFVNSTQAFQDRMIVNGTIRYKVLYLSEEENFQLKGITANVNFSYGLDIVGCKHGTKCKAKCEIENIEYELQNCRKIGIKTVLRVTGKATEEFVQEFISDLQEPEGVQLLKNSVGVKALLGDCKSDFAIKEALEVPAGKPSIAEIIRNDVKITGQDYKVTENKVIVKGEINIATLYIGDDENRSIQLMEHEIPFTQFLDLEGANEDSVCEVECQIGDIRFDGAEDSDGELRVMNGEIVLNINAAAFESKNIEMLVDAYNTKSVLNLERKEFLTEESLEEKKEQIALRETVTVDGEDRSISEVLNVICMPYLTEYRVVNEKLIIEGAVDASVLYARSDAGTPVSCHKKELPFKHELTLKEVKPGISCEIVLYVEHCNYSLISSGEIDLRVVVSASVKVINAVSTQAVVGVTESVLEEAVFKGRPSISVYFAKHGDTVWDIAKKYFTTAENIKKTNKLDEYKKICPGMQIIIPK